MTKKIILKLIPCLLFCTLSVAKSTKKQNLQKNNETRSLANKKKLEHPYPNKLIKDMSEQELQKTLVYAKAIKNNEYVLRILRALLSHSSDQNNLKTYKLDLADFFFEINELEKSAFQYEEFFMLYPGSKESDYTQYKAILCWFHLSLAPSRDQSITDKAIFLIEDFLRKAKDQKYIDEVKSIHKKCRKKLFEHEADVFETYLQQKKFVSAEKRLEYMKEKFQDIENLDKYLTHMQNMLKKVKGPKTCPFIIKLNLEDAITKKQKQSAHKKQKAALYFLS